MTSERAIEILGAALGDDRNATDEEINAAFHLGKLAIEAMVLDLEKERLSKLSEEDFIASREVVPLAIKRAEARAAFFSALADSNPGDAR